MFINLSKYERLNLNISAVVEITDQAKPGAVARAVYGVGQFSSTQVLL